MQLPTASISQICTDFSKLGQGGLRGGSSEVSTVTVAKQGHFSVLLQHSLSVEEAAKGAGLLPALLPASPPSLFCSARKLGGTQITIDTFDECPEVISSKHFAKILERKQSWFSTRGRNEQALLNIAQVFHFLRSFILGNIGVCNSEVTLTEYEIPRHMGFFPPVDQETRENLCYFEC